MKASKQLTFCDVLYAGEITSNDVYMHYKFTIKAQGIEIRSTSCLRKCCSCAMYELKTLIIP
jgi:hypothetical protein